MYDLTTGLDYSKPSHTTVKNYFGFNSWKAGSRTTQSGKYDSINASDLVRDRDSIWTYAGKGKFLNLHKKTV